MRAEAEVLGNAREGRTNLRLTLRVEGWPGFGPGQFAMLSPGPRASVERSDPLLPRPMAIYRDRRRGSGAEVEILYKVAGRGTALLAEGRPGQRVGLVAPLGRAFELPPPGQPALLVGGGTGVASLYRLAVELGAAATVLLGARSAPDLMGRADFEALPGPVECVTEDGSAGRRGLVTERLEELLAQGAGGRVYACGPTPMMRRTAELAAARGLPCTVSLENAMACGFGVCLGCAAVRADGSTALVCRDGPMFEAGGLDWQALP